MLPSMPSTAGEIPAREAEQGRRGRLGQRLFLVALLLLTAGSGASCGSNGSIASNGSSHPADGYVFDAKLSLTGTCGVSPADRVPDPGCPYPARHRPRPFSAPCGVATDRLGYIYVASSGHSNAHEGRVDVFDPRGRFVTEIELPRKISERPCRIDVDSRGRIYIAARPLAVNSVGNIDIHARPIPTAFRYAILRYAPNSYPPTAKTSYGQPIIFALTGESYGVAVDPSDDRVYVASGSVFEFTPGGRRLNTADAVQLVAVKAEGGRFTLGLGSITTKPMPFGASPASVGKALEGLSDVGGGNVAVSAGGQAGGSVRYRVTFTGKLADTEVQPLECGGARLSGGKRSCRVSTVRQGAPGGIGGGARDVDVWGRNHDLYVSSELPEGRPWLVQVFSGKGHRLLETVHGTSSDAAPPYVSIAVDQANGGFFVEDFLRHRIRLFARNRKTGRFEPVGSITHGRYLERLTEAGSDLAVDDSPRSPNHGYVFATSGPGAGHLYAFAPPKARPRAASGKSRAGGR